MREDVLTLELQKVSRRHLAKRHDYVRVQMCSFNSTGVTRSKFRLEKVITMSIAVSDSFVAHLLNCILWLLRASSCALRHQ